MSLSFSIVICLSFTNTSMCGNSIILRKPPEVTSSVDGKLFSQWGYGWTRRLCLCFCICFKGRWKTAWIELRSTAKMTELENHVLLYGSGLRPRNYYLPTLEFCRECLKWAFWDVLKNCILFMLLLTGWNSHPVRAVCQYQY